MNIRKLQLFEPIVCGTTDDTGTGILRQTRTAVTESDCDPLPEACLPDCEPVLQNQPAEIPAGSYIFYQGFLPPDIPPFTAGNIPSPQIRQAGYEFWLGLIWEELTPADNNIYIRILLHEGEYTDTATGQKKSAGTVFQLFRRVVSFKE